MTIKFVRKVELLPSQSSAFRVKAVLNDFAIVPETGGNCCLTADNGAFRTTTAVAFAIAEDGRKYVKTRSGSVYQLGTEQGSIWSLGLQIKRPHIHEKLVQLGIL